MMMIQGAKNYLLATPALGVDHTQGCVVVVTRIAWALEALILLLALTTVVLSVLLTYYGMHLRL
jgi:hypothetical protein